MAEASPPAAADVISLMDEVLGHVDKSLPEGDIAGTFGTLHAAGLWLWAIDLFTAIKLLLKERLPGPARALLRMLMETCVQVRYLNDQSGELEKLAVQFSWYSLRKRRGALEAERVALEADATLPREPHDADREDIERKEKLLRERARDAGFTGDPPAPPGPEVMARQLGHHTHGWLARVTGEFVHGGDPAIFERVRYVGGSLQLRSEIEEHSLVSVGAAATAALMEAYKSVSALLAWSSHDDVQRFSIELYGRVARLVRALGTAEGE